MFWKQLSLTAVALATVLCSASPRQTGLGTAADTPVLDFHAPAGDPYANAIRDDASASVKQIQLFFGAPFPDPIHFEMVADRASFDAAVAKFGLSPTQCWMVGLGTADLMVVLSPQAWAKQACEHDPNDPESTRLLVTHELIHVYHGQFNPTRDFTGIDDLDWFIEGLAVFGSRQLTKDRLDQMQAAVAAGQVPTSLSKIWTGPNRYAFAGSLVRYVDQTWGRATTVRLLKVRSSAEALTLLGTTEKSMLAGWQASLMQP
jgi:hypothetical protein